MLIENLRVVDNDTMDTPNGTVTAPVTYYMDVSLEDKKIVSVPINCTTFSTLHSIAVTGEMSESVETIK